MPSVSPALMSKLMPLTAWTMPRLVENRTCRSSTERSFALSTAAKLRIERLAQPVPDQVEAEDGDDDRDPRNDCEERSRHEIVVHVREHRPPLGRRGILRPEPEEAERGHVDDRSRHRE